MKQLYTTVLIFAAFLAVSGVAYGGGLNFKATLSGAQEVPEVATPATGTITAKFDDGFTQVVIDLRVKDPIGVVTAAHFHCAPPGANGSVALGLFSPGPLVFDGKGAKGTLTNADITGTSCGDNLIALAFAMRDGLIYANVHTDAFPGGEIRGQLLED